MKFAIFYLTCANEEEADDISRVLLEKRLVACAKKFPVASVFRWKDKIEDDEELLVMFESIEENFEKAEAEIRKLHSYETFVFFSVPVSKTTKETQKWLETEIKK